MAHNPAIVLEIVKTRLNRLASGDPIESHLTQRISAADIELERTGITLIAADIDDAMFLADFVAWKYQNRDKPAGMPEWLKLARRERWLSGKGREVT